MMEEPKAFEVYRHFKGNLYQIIALAEEEGSGNTLVVYQGLYAPFKVYARPLSAFLERLDPIKYPNAAQEYRFEHVAEIGFTEAQAAESSEKGAAPVEGISAEAVSGRDASPEGMPADGGAVVQASVGEVSVEGTLAGASALGRQEGEPAEPAESTGGINPDLLLFLDAREPEEKLDALFRIQSRLTPDMLTVIEMSQGMEPQETWTVGERYKHIKNNILTKQKYEQKRM